MTKAQGDSIDEKVGVIAGLFVSKNIFALAIVFFFLLICMLVETKRCFKKFFCSVHYIWMLHNAVVCVKPKASQQGCVATIMLVKAAIAEKLWESQGLPCETQRAAGLNCIMVCNMENILYVHRNILYMFNSFRSRQRFWTWERLHFLPHSLINDADLCEDADYA